MSCEGDLFVPEERFAFLQERLGDGFVAVEHAQADGKPVGLESPAISAHHSVLTIGLVDEEGGSTRTALDQVLEMLRDRPI